jgi:homocysteine S-methyltransferase
MDSTAWCGLATQSHPEVLRQIHIDYIGAGADIITTNTFATGRHVLEPLGLRDEAETLDRTAVAIARQAIEAAAEREVLIAGSMSSMGPLDRSQSTPRGDAAEIGYGRQAETLAEAGVDVLVVEMLRDIANASLVIAAATAVGLPVLVGWSASSDEPGEFVPYRSEPYREHEQRSFNELMRLGAEMGGDVAGVMHSAVEVTGPALEILNRHWTGPTMAYAETGRFEPPNWVFTEATAPEG